MEINAQEVISRLSQKIGTLESEKTVMQVQIEMLQDENTNLSAQASVDVESADAPLEGDLVG